MNISILRRRVQEVKARPAAERPVDLVGELRANGSVAKERIVRQMVRECEAMVEHALTSGLTVPVEVLQRLDDALSADRAPPNADPLSRAAASSNVGTESPNSTESIRKSALVSLAMAHSALAVIIAPATPGTVRLLADERANHPILCSFGPLPVVRRMLGLAVVSLFALLAVNTSDQIGPQTFGRNLLELSGYKFLLAETFLLSAASLGSCFANLQKVNAFISDGTYDPKFQSTYWTRWVMGVISGIVLSQLVYDVLFQNHATDSPSAFVPASLGQPILALLGGYSFDVVYGILNHIIDTVRRFFLGDREGSEEKRENTRLTGAAAQERLTSAVYLATRQPSLAPSANIDEKGQYSAERTNPLP